MTIFKSKDFAAGKSDKVRKAVGRKLGLGAPASNNQVDEEVTQHLRELVEVDDTADWAATKPAPDPL